MTEVKETGLRAVFARAVWCSDNLTLDSVPYTASPRDIQAAEDGDLRKALDMVILHTQPEDGLESLRRSGVLPTLFPELTPVYEFGGAGSGHKELWWHTKRVVAQTPAIAPLRWAALFHDVGKPATFVRRGGKVEFHGHEWKGYLLWERIRRRRPGLWPDGRRIGNIIRDLGRVESYSSDWTDAAVRRLDREIGDHLGDTIDVGAADCTSKHAHKRSANLHRMNELRARIDALREVDALPPPLPKGLGMPLAKKLGISPGPELGAAMAALRSRVESGELLRGESVEYYLDHA